MVKEEPETGEVAASPQFAFNAAQLAAIAHESGPALILAGPGTGKTRVLVNRIQRLVESEIARNNFV